MTVELTRGMRIVERLGDGRYGELHEILDIMTVADLNTGEHITVYRLERVYSSSFLDHTKAVDEETLRSDYVLATDG